MENVIQIPLSLGETLRLEFDEADGSVGCGDAVTGIYNAVAWYMLEEVCRSYVDLLD